MGLKYLILDILLDILLPYLVYDFKMKNPVETKIITKLEHVRRPPVSRNFGYFWRYIYMDEPNRTQIIFKERTWSARYENVRLVNYANRPVAYAEIKKK